MTARRYTNPEAFKQALEHRLRSSTTDGVAFARRRQVIVFERFIARLALEMGNAVVLKGGVVLEMRLGRARATRDVDLRVTGPSAGIVERLQRAARRDEGDFMEFEVIPDPEHPTIEAEGMKYDGLRFRAECRLAGRLYAQPFGVDVAFAEPLHGSPDTLWTGDTLAFAGIPRSSVLAYPVETHIAEKIHAYTVPRPRPNSRVKDLPDIALLASIRPINATDLRQAIERSFDHRATHAPPKSFPAPASSWLSPYARMAEDNRLPWRTLEDVTRAAQAFLDPVLAGSAESTWDPAAWTWRSG